MEQRLQSAGFFESLAVLVKYISRTKELFFVWILLLLKSLPQSQSYLPICLKAQQFLRKICCQFHPADDLNITEVSGGLPQARRARDEVRLQRGSPAEPCGLTPLRYCVTSTKYHCRQKQEYVRWMMKNSLLGFVNLSCRCKLVSPRIFILPAGESLWHQE